jgi:hypothetical protein
MVTVGIDTHNATLAVSAIDEAGRERAAETFPTTGRDTSDSCNGPGSTLRSDASESRVPARTVRLWRAGSSRRVSRWSRCPRC